MFFNQIAIFRVLILIFKFHPLPGNSTCSWSLIWPTCLFHIFNQGKWIFCKMECESFWLSLLGDNVSFLDTNLFSMRNKKGFAVFLAWQSIICKEINYFTICVLRWVYSFIILMLTLTFRFSLLDDCAYTHPIPTNCPGDISPGDICPKDICSSLKNT